MDASETLLSALLQKYPNLEQLSDGQLKNALADIFGSNTDAHRVAFNLIRGGQEEVQPTRPVQKINPHTPQPLTKAAKQKLLNAHPQLPYPPYTFRENIRDYGREWLSYIGRAIWWTILFGAGAGVLYLFLHFVSNIFGCRNLSITAYIAFGIGVLIAIIYAVKDFHEMKEQINKDRCEQWRQDERLREIIAKQGHRKNAESIMRTIYNDIRINKDTYSYTQKIHMLTIAYEKALEEVLCYFSKNDRWEYLEANGDTALNKYSYLFTKYYGDNAFKPYEQYESELMVNKPLPYFDPIPGTYCVPVGIPANYEF